MMDEEQERLSMKQQFIWLNDMLDSLPVQTMIYDGIEADDTIAYITEMYEVKSKKITIVSTDRDFYILSLTKFTLIKKKILQYQTCT